MFIFPALFSCGRVESLADEDDHVKVAEEILDGDSGAIERKSFYVLGR